LGGDRNCMGRRLAGAIAGVSMVLSTGALAHSLADVEAALNAREFFLQVVNQPAPDFSLEDADGRAISLKDLKGKVVVLYFIYASCTDVCPLHSEKLSEIQQAINVTPMRDRVWFVAITTDPEHDTPDVLKSYGPTHGLDPVNWLFLTSGAAHPSATRDLAERYGLKFTSTSDGRQVHGIVTHIIDKSGMLRARYHGLKFSSTNFIVHLNALTNDTH
jgi:protein SCO1/2